MGEENLEQQTERTPAARPSRTTRGQQRRRQRSVFQYITILFAAALVLLLYTFMMEHRQYELQQQQNEANISNLQQQSVSAVQTLQGMTEENKQLKDKVSELEGQIKALEQQLSTTETDQTFLQTQLQNAEKVTEAMSWFWQLNDAYAQDRTKECQELISSMEETGLAKLLPAENSTGTDHPAPAERYQEIYNKVIK